MRKRERRIDDRIQLKDIYDKEIKVDEVYSNLILSHLSHSLLEVQCEIIFISVKNRVCTRNLINTMCG